MDKTTIALNAMLIEDKLGNWSLRLYTLNKAGKTQYDGMRAKFMDDRTHRLVLILRESGFSMNEVVTASLFDINGGPDIQGSEYDLVQLRKWKPSD